MGPRCTLHRPGTVDYQHAWEWQQRIAGDVRSDGDPALILLQHPHTYTLGVRGQDAHLLLSEQAYAARGATVVRVDRGGDVTYHGPGQIVGYPILDLRSISMGASAYVHALEDVMVAALSRFGISAGVVAGRPGVWCKGADGGGAKIGAIGVRVSRGVTTHGFALNVNTDLSYFDAIVPCGLQGVRVTSMQEALGRAVAITDVEDALIEAFERRFEMPVAEPEMAGAPGGR